MNQKSRSTSRLGLILLIFVAFMSLGLPDSLFGIGLPSIRSDFQIPLDAVGLLMVFGSVGYLVSSFFSGHLIGRMGVGGLLAASCCLTGLALLGYTLVPEWWMMVLLGVFSGLGAGAIDAGLNTYAADNFHEGLMQWLHACYGVGVTIGPIIMTLGLNYLNTWRFGYRVVGFFQLLLSLCFILTLKMWKQHTGKSPAENGKKIAGYRTPYSETLKQSAVWLSMLLFFLYVGAEISLGTWTYTLLTESRGVSIKIAGFLSGSYFLMFTVGRVLAGLYAKKIGTHTIINASLIGALIGSILLLINVSNTVSVIGVALAGFSIAPIFAALVSGTSRRVSPKFASNTIGMQMAAAGIGGAVIAPLVGVLARHVSLETFPVVLTILFVVLLGIYVITMQSSEKRILIEEAQPTFSPADGPLPAEAEALDVK